jgi:hypothetical protein
LKASLFISVVLLAPSLLADTIYQTTAEGKQIVLQRDAIVTQEDASFLQYKHFDLKERRVTTVNLNRGSTLAYSVQKSEPAERQQIVNKWKAFGFKATITSQAGKITHVADVYLDFYPPGGHGSLLESVAARTTLPLQLDNGGADEFDFAKIDQVNIQGDHLVLTMREGQTFSGKFLMPTTQPAEARVLGITDQYDPASKDVFDFSVPLAKLKMISFE